MRLESVEDTGSMMVAKVGELEGGPLNLQSLLEAGLDVGQTLRTLREAKGLSLQDVAQVTCVRRAYLEAVEDMKLDLLPTGPFASGYVRAYAQAIGAPPELAVRAFRQHTPSGEDSLRPPSGMTKHRNPHLSLFAGAGALVVSAVVIWNVAQHAVARDGAPTPPAPVVNGPPAAPLAARGPVALGAAQPAPADSDVPAPYVTPGMAKAVGGAADAPPLVKRLALNPHAAAYGAPADRAVLTLQAQKPATLVVRGADGSIYFARQLAAGESFRAPANVPGLRVDVSDAQAFDVIVTGQDRGPLPAAQTPVDKLIG